MSVRKHSFSNRSPPTKNRRKAGLMGMDRGALGSPDDDRAAPWRHDHRATRCHGHRWPSHDRRRAVWLPHGCRAIRPGAGSSTHAVGAGGGLRVRNYRQQQERRAQCGQDCFHFSDRLDWKGPRLADYWHPRPSMAQGGRLGRAKIGFTGKRTARMFTGPVPRSCLRALPVLAEGGQGFSGRPAP